MNSARKARALPSARWLKTPACIVTLGADVQAFESSKGQHLELEVLTLLVQHLQRWRQELGIDGKQDSGEEVAASQSWLPPAHWQPA